MKGPRMAKSGDWRDYLDVLTDKQRAVMVLFLSGMNLSHKEMGKMLNISPLASRLRLFKAIRKIRREIKET